MQILDKGYVKLYNVAGPFRRPEQAFDASDRDPALAARMSFDMMNEDLHTEEEDIRLADYLYRNKHTSPFEMIEVWLTMKMPIFVARQIVRHRTASLNEISARYVEMPDDWHIPDVVRCQSKSNKQGSEGTVGPMITELFRNNLNGQCKESYKLYLWALSAGVCKEQAREFLHLNHYTVWLWKQDLHNLFGMLRQRDHSHAQWEAAQYAKAVTTLVSEVLPKSFEIYRKYS